MPADRPWPLGVEGIAYGGDDNPEQWPEAVRIEDMDLMREAGVSVVSVAIFAWATLEPREGEYDFGWLDAEMDRLHAAGIKAALTTATASPVFRASALHMTRVLAERYRDHPALALRHVDNELGCHVPHDCSDSAATAFRSWLQARYGSIEALNTAPTTTT